MTTSIDETGNDGGEHHASLEGTLSEVLTRAIAAIHGESVTLRQLLDLLGGQGLLVLCALLTLPFLIPVSIPGVSTVFGSAIVLLGIALTLDRLPWVPRRLLDRRLPADRLVPVLTRAAALVHRGERVIRPRLPRFVEGRAATRLACLALTAGGLLLCVPLGFVPFSNTLPAVAVLLFAAGLSQRDGLAVLLGYGMNVLTVLYFAGLAWLTLVAGQSLTAVFG